MWKSEYTKEQTSNMRNNLDLLTRKPGVRAELAALIITRQSTINHLIKGPNLFHAREVDIICNYLKIEKEMFMNSKIINVNYNNHFQEPGFPIIKTENCNSNTLIADIDESKEFDVEITDTNDGEVESKDSEIVVSNNKDNNVELKEDKTVSLEKNDRAQDNIQNDMITSYQQYKIKSISSKNNIYAIIAFSILFLIQIIGTSLQLVNDRITYYTSMVVMLLMVGSLIYLAFSSISNIGFKTRVILIDSRKKVIFENKAFNFKGVSILYTFVVSLFSCVTLTFLSIGYIKIDWLSGILVLYFIVLGIFTIIQLIAIKSRYTARIDYRLYYLSSILRYSVIILFLLSVGYVFAINSSFWVHLVGIIFSSFTLFFSESLHYFVLKYYEGYQKEEN